MNGLKVKSIQIVVWTGLLGYTHTCAPLPHIYLPCRSLKMQVQSIYLLGSENPAMWSPDSARKAIRAVFLPSPRRCPQVLHRCSTPSSAFCLSLHTCPTFHIRLALLSCISRKKWVRWKVKTHTHKASHMKLPKLYELIECVQRLRLTAPKTGHWEKPNVFII